MNILSIETSCDETAAAVVRDGYEPLSDVIASSCDAFVKYGGVVPEIASRKHLEYISDVCSQAVSDAGVTFWDIDAVAVTNGPGLVGALLVGVSAAKALAYALKKPLIAVHHIKAHICANYIEEPELKPPFVGLVASGGHSHIIYARDYVDFEILAKTRDDAAGEAFDKIARVLSLGYPGGPLLEALAKDGNDQAYKFPRVKFSDYDFSFSGVKTAVINEIHKAKQSGAEINRADVAASFQRAVVDVLVNNTVSLAIEKKVEYVVMAGGVACNKTLYNAFFEQTQRHSLKLICPKPRLCTDNAVMVGCCAYFLAQKQEFADMTLNAFATMPL